MSFKIVVVAATAGIVAGVTGALTLGPILRDVGVGVGVSKY